MLNSGGTLKDILNYGQNAATQNYQNVVNQDLQAYDTNYQTQYVDPYNFAYSRAKDLFQLPNSYALQSFADQCNALTNNASMS